MLSQIPNAVMTTAIRDNNPVLFFEDRMTYNMKGAVPDGEHVVPLGQAEIKREGSDVTLIAMSRMVHVALAAADQLADEGIEAEVIDPRTLVPLDRASLIDSVRKTSRAVVIDGGHETYGITGEIAAVVSEGAFDYLDAPVLRLGAPNNPVPCSRTLESLMVPSAEQICAKVRSQFG